MDSPLFSVVLTGRNDNYGGLFLKRLELSINYFAFGMDRINTSIKYEIIALDWCSDEPLSSVLNLTPEAMKVTRFIIVEPELADKYNKDGMNFNSPVSLNAGILRANGKYIVHMPADILFTFYSLSRLCEVLNADIPLYFNPAKSLLLIKRYIIPQEYNETDKDYQELDRYLSMTTNWLECNSIVNGVCADFGALIFTKEIWEEVGGFDESMTSWGKTDSRFGFIANVNYPAYELSGLGVFCYDPTVNNANIKNKIKSGNKACDIDFCAKDKNFGLKEYNLKEYKLDLKSDINNKDAKKNISDDGNKKILLNVTSSNIKKVLPFNAIYIQPCLYPLYWVMKNFKINTYCEFISEPNRKGSCLTEIMLIDDSAAALVSAVNPSVEIVSIVSSMKKKPCEINHTVLGRQYLNKKSGKLGFLRTLVNELFPNNVLQHKWHPGFAEKKHHGLVHYIIGKADTAITRLKKRFDEKFKVDLFLFRASEVSSPENTFYEILEIIEESGLIIIVDKHNTILGRLPELVGSKFIAYTNPIKDIAIVFHRNNLKMLGYTSDMFVKDSNSWVNHFLLFNYARGLIFSALTFLKKKIER